MVGFVPPHKRSAALVDAIQAQNLALTTWLLRKSTRIHPDALPLAIKKGDLEIAKLLLHHGAACCPPSFNTAVSENKPEFIELLFAQSEFSAFSILKTAVEQDRVELVDLLLKKGGYRFMRYSLLECAAKTGNIEIFRLLRRFGDIGRAHMWAALKGAIEYEKVDMVRVLFESYKMRPCRACFRLAVNMDNPIMLDLVLTHGEPTWVNEIRLFDLVCTKRDDMLAVVLKHGAEVYAHLISHAQGTTRTLLLQNIKETTYADAVRGGLFHVLRMLPSNADGLCLALHEALRLQGNVCANHVRTSRENIVNWCILELCHLRQKEKK